MTDDATEPSGRRLGVAPMPRALLSWDGPQQDRIAEVLALYAPTIREIRSLRDVRQADYDLLVTDRMQPLTWMGSAGEAREPADHLCVISFIPSGDTGNRGTVDAFAPPGNVAIDWRSPHLANSIEVPDDLLDAARDLVEDDLVPAALARNSHHYFVPALWQHWKNSRPLPGVPSDAPEIQPFLLTTPPDQKVLAGWYLRSPGSEAWVLPSDLKRPWDWVAAAVRHWAVTYGRFPLVGGWWEDRRWQTVAESEAARMRAALEAELADVTARLQAEISSATSALHQARREAAEGRRRLLSEKGNVLKHAAADALGQLGYKVIDRDKQEAPADKGGKVEDLGIIDPDDLAVDPIVEVKGYDRGAKASDLALMLRHASRALRGGRTPTPIWWIANHWRKRSPDDRGLLLAGEDAMIALHADDEVPLVLIDTRDVFRAVRAVEEGRVAPSDVRASLRAARGRWEAIPE